MSTKRVVDYVAKAQKKVLFGTSTFNDGMKFTVHQGREFDAALRAEVANSKVSLTDSPADLAKASDSIANMLATNPTWSENVKAVSSVQPTFFRIAVERLVKNAMGSSQRSKAKSTKPTVTKSDTSDLNEESKINPLPSNRKRKAPTVDTPPPLGLVWSFADEVLKVRLVDGEWSIVASDSS